MRKIKESVRIKEIEIKWNDSIENLLYKWHWKDNLMHREIGKKLSIPRATITRWFKYFDIPTQPCTRFTNLNLLNVGPRKTPPAKPKIKKPRPVFLENKNFFKKWSPEMAYVLGYFTADGCMFINPRGSHYIEFTSTDRELIEKVRELMKSNHSIGEYEPSNLRWRTKYTLEIGSKEMFQDLLRLSLTPHKSNRIKLPSIPQEYLSDFVRGYFDGDGCPSFGIYRRKTRKSKAKHLNTRFISGNKKFLENLLKMLRRNAHLKGGFIVKKSKDSGFELSFSINDSKKLYKFMYEGVSNSRFLERKYNKFQKALKYLGA
jgi:hypothetical protein